MLEAGECLTLSKEKYLYILLLIAIIVLPKFMYYLYILALPAIGKEFAVGKSMVTSFLNFKSYI